MSDKLDLYGLLENKIRSEIVSILEDIDIGTFPDIETFEKILIEDDIIISDYQLGVLYTLAELYFELSGKVNKYNKYIELIANFDINQHDISEEDV